MADPLAHPTVYPVPRWERWAIALLLVAFVVVGLNNISNDAFIGQDWSFHVGCTNLLLGRPDAWFSQDITNRPLIYWIAVDGIYLTDNRAPFQFAACVFVLFNVGALWLLYDCTRRFIAAPALRVAALALIAFSPATLITTVVFAADAMAAPPFALLCWSLLRWVEAPTDRASAGFAALAGVALAVGNFAKFTFILLPVGVLVVAFLAWRWRQAGRRRGLILIALAALMPGLVGLWLHQAATRALAHRPQHHQFNWRGTGEMTWRSLLGLKGSDVRIFDAPGYWDPGAFDGKSVFFILKDNDFSYPALLHLGTFTDVLDFSYGGSKRSGRPRPEPQKSFSQWSVRLGVLFSLPAVIAVAVFTVRTLRSVVKPNAPPRFGLIVWLVLGLNWYVPLVVTLPMVQYSYIWGYWLPRLVLPGLWAFGLCLFTFVDERVASRRLVVTAVAIVTLIQTYLQIRSVWY